MATTPDTEGAQLRFLVGGLVLVAGLLTVSTAVAGAPWLSLAASLLLLVVALAGVRRGVPRLLVLITLGFAVVLAGTAVLPWWADPAPARATPDVVDAPAPILVSGIVSDSGRPLSGVPVQVMMWPSKEEAEVGESFDLEQLDPVMTDAQGRYVVSLALADVDPSYLLQGRVLNFQVALSDPFVSPISTSARFPRRGSDWVDVFDDRDGEPKTLDFDLGAMQATETSGGTVHTWPLFRLERHPAPN